MVLHTYHGRRKSYRASPGRSRRARARRRGVGPSRVGGAGVARLNLICAVLQPCRPTPRTPVCEDCCICMLVRGAGCCAHSAHRLYHSLDWQKIVYTIFPRVAVGSLSCGVSIPLERRRSLEHRSVPSRRTHSPSTTRSSILNQTETRARARLVDARRPFRNRQRHTPFSDSQQNRTKPTCGVE